MFFAAACVLTLTAFALARNAESDSVPVAAAADVSQIQTSDILHSENTETGDTPDTAKFFDVTQNAVETPDTSDSAERKITSRNESAVSKNTSSKGESTTSKNTSSKDESTISKNMSSKNESNTSTSTSSKNESTTPKNTSSKKESNTSTSTSSEDDTQSQVKTKTPPKEYQLKIKHYSQSEEMPTGCEIVSTRMVLDYYGMDKFSYGDIISHLTRCDLKVSKDGKLYGKSPFEAFIGNPKEISGFGCYPPVIIDMIEDFDFENLYAEDTSGLPLDFVAKTYVSQDIPVLVWVTIDMRESYLTDSWYLTDENGKITKDKYHWRAEEHCMVLVGYDEKYYYFSDPLSDKQTVKFEKELVEKRYKEIGKYSMIIRRESN